MKSYIVIISCSLILLLILLVLLPGQPLIKEDIIPEVKIAGHTVVKKSKSKEDVFYYLGKEKSSIILTNSIKYSQDVRRYLHVEGYIRSYKKKLFRSVIFEVTGKTGGQQPSYFFLPIDSKGRFSGYIYFRESGAQRVHAFLFIDYTKAAEELSIPPEVETTAHLAFFTWVIEPVPAGLHHLLPTKNVDCGNKQIRKLAARITSHCTTDLEKARAIYEYLVFGEESFRMKYNKIYVSCRDVTFHNAAIASQILVDKKGVCNDYAEVYAALLRSTGVKVKKIWGFTDETEETGHMWNLVDPVGDEKSWIPVDPTWGSQDKKNYQKWAGFYPGFNKEYFDTALPPYSHNTFTYKQKIEY